jgi:hypothetical protein
VAVPINPVQHPQPGDIRVEPEGVRCAIYAPNVSVGGDWLGVDPTNGGQWLTSAQVSGWLNVSLPTDGGAPGDGPYAPGDLKVPPDSTAGSVTQFAVKTGPPLSDITNWFVCSIRNAGFAVQDSYIDGWIDVKRPTE